ncbi:recombinase family protein [Chitinophaga sp. 22536]|uniref:recombinase family protein n=1 Tax=unclassified Chitinophaga TaxID=2619133 RepID=UPI003F84B694
MKFHSPYTKPMEQSMTDMEYFKRFVPKKEEETKKNFSVWSYTRVSSKEQYDKNSSIENQIDANRRYAKLNNYEITDEFGGKYESAKKDDFRPEFKRLIEKVEKSRQRPFAILLFKMSRFSRSGASAIGLVDRLVKELGVHLIEVSSGHSTLTPRGEMAIIDSLSHAKKENLERLEIIVPFMQASLRSGKRFGICPVGYDHYGPRVQNEKFFAKHQRIEINKDGELLKEAWQWKLSGHYSDAQILGRLALRGLHLLPQKLSKIWRNPFYCGVLVSKMIDEPVKGKWPPLVSQEDFMKVQQILENNLAGYQHNKEEVLRPLTRHVKCVNCKGYMLGYINRKKNLHYYRCRQCAGLNINAHTTKQAKRKGLNDLFLDFLDNFTISPAVVPLVKLQLTKLFDHFNQDNGNDDRLKEQMTALEQQLKNLKIRHGLGDIDKETYDLTTEHLNGKIKALHKELGNEIPKVLNLDKLLTQSLEKLQDLRLVWTSSDLDGKRRLQKTIFPDGFYYDASSHQCLTDKLNEFVRVSAKLARVSPEKEKGKYQDLLDTSLSVARSGLEPETSGL